MSVKIETQIEYNESVSFDVLYFEINIDSFQNYVNAIYLEYFLFKTM